MSKKREIETYSINELEPEIQKKVIEMERESMLDDNFYIDDIEQDAISHGTDLFNGKGISWKDKDIDKDKMPNVTFDLDNGYMVPMGVFVTKNLTIIMKENQRFSGAPTYNVFDVDGYDLEDLSDGPSKSEAKVATATEKREFAKFMKDYKEISRTLLESARENMERLLAEDTIKEELKSNEREFLKDGRYAPKEVKV